MIGGRLFYLREGTRHVEILAFPFAAAREPEKLFCLIMVNLSAVIGL